MWGWENKVDQAGCLLAERILCGIACANVGSNTFGVWEERGVWAANLSVWAVNISGVPDLQRLHSEIVLKLVPRCT
jgi:hypothetical protein